MRVRSVFVISVLVLASCVAPSSDSGTTSATSETAAPTLYPDVIGVDVEAHGGTWDFAVTMTSPYDSPERYADAFRIVGDDGVVYGLRELTHDHASEQPFTRSITGVQIPPTVTAVTVEGRDQVSGWGGKTVTIELQ